MLVLAYLSRIYLRACVCLPLRAACVRLFVCPCVPRAFVCLSAHLLAVCASICVPVPVAAVSVELLAAGIKGAGRTLLGAAHAVWMDGEAPIEPNPDRAACFEHWQVSLLLLFSARLRTEMQ